VQAICVSRRLWTLRVPADWYPKGVLLGLDGDSRNHGRPSSRAAARFVRDTRSSASRATPSALRPSQPTALRDLPGWSPSCQCALIHPVHVQTMLGKEPRPVSLHQRIVVPERSEHQAPFAVLFRNVMREAVGIGPGARLIVELRFVGFSPGLTRRSRTLIPPTPPCRVRCRTGMVSGLIRAVDKRGPRRMCMRSVRPLTGRGVGLSWPLL
jgi:hypothetical protein